MVKKSTTRTWLIVFAVFLYGLGFLISISAPFVGLIPGIGDAAAAAGSIAEEMLQLLGIFLFGGAMAQK